MQSIPITAVIITFNEESKIRHCLDSLSFCDEIIVVDSGSEDRTREISQQCGATVIIQEWLGYGPQKKFAVEQAKNNWVLCLDADEVVSDELHASIIGVDFNDKATAAYKMPRRNHFMGKPLFHGEGYPDWSLRLFNRLFGNWSNDAVHEGVEVAGKVGKLTGDLLHYSEESITSYLSKQNRYTQLQAEALFKKNKRASPMQCLLSPVSRFIKFYFLRLGFLDGLPGFVHISIGCFNAFCKYSKLYELQIAEKNKTAR